MRIFKYRPKWQDVVLTITSCVFAPSLVVSILNGTQMPLGTTLPTSLALLAIVVVDISLKLYIAAATTLITAICWGILIFI